MAQNDATPLTNKALERLRALGEGNGFAKDSLELIETVEKVYTLEARLRLSPTFSVKPKVYPGPVQAKGKNVKILPNFAALQNAVEQRRSSFETSETWLPQAIAELKDSPGHGWGQDNAKITFGADVKGTGAVVEKLAANEKCPQCQATGLITCAACQGKSYIPCTMCYERGEEPCYRCYGKGEDPAYPGQPCQVCRGTKMAPCRTCNGKGRLPCPQCQGRGGTPCPACKGRGSVTQEVEIDSSATLRFEIRPNGELPSGLLRSLDRLGMANLPKGHGDIELIEPAPDAPAEAKKILTLRASVPFAEIKARLNKRAGMIYAFGKRGVLVGVPPFLDVSLRPWREELARAAMGSGDFDKALKARLMRQALELELCGQGTLKNLRQRYPIGLSEKAATEILANLQQALRRFTLRARATAAMASVAASGAVIAYFFLTSSGEALLRGLLPPSPKALLAFKAFLPVGLVGAASYALMHATRWGLRRRFPDQDIRLNQRIGKLGYAALCGILALYGGILTLANHATLAK